METNYTVISVESRKGGVGKTTAALNLARILLESKKTKNVILFLDIDITGTNIADSLDSSYWNEITHLVKYKEDNVNLLEIYQKLYMPGRDIPNWEIIEKNSDLRDFNICIDKINVIGSLIYNQHNKNNNGENFDINNLICKPNILFDELHAFWFVEFLKLICDTFAQKVLQKNQCNIIIIIDNSPGFVGINPAIQDWLTDLGPQKGKFLTVSSLDIQDLISCAEAANELHNNYLAKLNASQKYLEIKNGKSPEIKYNLKGNSEKFFLKLINENQFDEKDYYKNELIINKINYKSFPSQYQSILVNKVPIEIKKNYFYFDAFKKLCKINYPPILNNLLEINKRNNKKYFVFYDDYINFQFMECSISVNRRRKNNYPERIKNIISELRQFIVIENRKMILERNINSIQHYLNIFKDMNILQNKLLNLLTHLEIGYYSNIVKLIKEEYYPLYPFNALRNLVSNIFQNSRYFFGIEESINIENENDIYGFKLMVDEITDKILRERKIERELTREKFFLECINSFKLVLYYTIQQFVKKSPHYEEIFDVFSFIFNIQIKRLLEEKLKRRFIPQNIIIREENYKEFFERYQFEKFERLLNHIDYDFENSENSLLEFYNSFCMAQFRLLDAENDFNFLMFVIDRLIAKSTKTEGDKFLYPEFRDILDKVIIEKSISHLQARESIEKGLRNTNSMTEFKKVLTNIIRKWDLIK